MTPYEAGIGAFVDLDKTDFIGRDALAKADQNCLLWGLTCGEAIPFAGLRVFDGNAEVGRMTAGAWTPYLDTGIGFVRFQRTGDWQGRKLTLRTREGSQHACKIASLPFYDAEKKIPRGGSI